MNVGQHSVFCSRSIDRQNCSATWDHERLVTANLVALMGPGSFFTVRRSIFLTIVKKHEKKF
jgi:hypothetical protein